MKLKILIILALFSLSSCSQKKHDKQITAIKENSTSIIIGKDYQKDEPTNDRLLVNSKINFSEKYNTPQIWEFSLGMKQGRIAASKQLSNGNFVYIIEKGDGNYNFSPFLIIIDKSGNQVAKQKIKLPGDIKYKLYSPAILAENNGSFTMYFTAEKNSQQSSSTANDKKLENNLSQKLLYKIKMDGDYSAYHIQSKNMSELFLNKVKDNNVTDFIMDDFNLKILNNQFILMGTAMKENETFIPLIANIDSALNLKTFNIFEAYSGTEIDKISLEKDGNFLIEGKESSGADGFYYLTHKRMIIDKNLNLVADQSDKEPFSSNYRGPSAPDDPDEIDSTEDSQTVSETAQTYDSKKPELQKSVFYTDEANKIYYSFSQKEINDNKIIFEKSKTADSTAIWRIKFSFPDHYEVPYVNSSKGFLCKNSDLVCFLYLRDKSVKNETMSAVIFVFNKTGRLIRQFQTTPYFSITDFFMDESEGKLITGFMGSDAIFINGDWQYPTTFKTMSFDLE